MRKMITILTATFIMILAAAGCGGGTADNSADTSFEELALLPDSTETVSIGVEYSIAKEETLEAAKDADVTEQLDIVEIADDTDELDTTDETDVTDELDTSDDATETETDNIPAVNTEGAATSPPAIEDGEFIVIDYPAYGDRSSINVTVELTKGDPQNYNYVVLVEVNGRIYGRKPYHDYGLIPVKAGRQSLQFDSNDSMGEDHLATKIFIYLIDRDTNDGINPSSSTGWEVPAAQVSHLESVSIYHAVISRA